MWFLLLAACGEPDDGPKDTGAHTEAGTLAARAAPSTVDFGTVAVGVPATTTITVWNDGTADFGITSVVTGSGVVDATFLPTSVTPGGSQDVTLTWTPASRGDLSGIVRVAVESFEAGSTQLSVPMSGSAGGADLQLSATEVNFGSVTVGCAAREALTIHNGGDQDLVIDSAAFLETPDLTLVASDGTALPELPWTIAAGADLPLAIAYAPTDLQDISDSLRLHSNDPDAPTVDLRTLATARAEEEISIEYPAVHEQYVTMIWSVNTVAVHGMFAEAFLGALATLFETLNDTGVPYRVAFVVENSGIVAGSEPYIDETFDIDEATEAARTMLDPAGGDLDTMFQTLGNAIDNNRTWLLDEDPAWQGSRLSLVNVNNDIEQSSGNYVTWVATYQAYKAYPEDLLVHSFGGDVPRGCTGADPAQAFYDAATLTGGKFYSICAENWTASMAELAVATLGDGYQEYALTATPLEWTINVYVDDIRQLEGWGYDEEKNIVTFDEGWNPPIGSIVRVGYLAAPEECPDVE